MKEIVGDIWDYHKDGNWIVIPTNGVVKKNGKAIMGKGLALQAAQKFPDLPLELGQNISRGGNHIYWYYHWRIITFPTKNDWKEKSSLDLIKCNVISLIMLSGNHEIIYLPRLGCGNGGLSWKEQVRPLLTKYLDDRFIVVDNNRGNK